MKKYPHNTLILTKEPFVGFMPEDLQAWLDESRTDGSIAMAYAEVYNHVGSLGHELDESDDPWLRYALDKWVELEKRLCREILSRTDVSVDYQTVPCAKDLYWKVGLFMEANGFRDGAGWWVEKK